MDIFQDWTIASTYVLCSAVGGVILTLQLVLMMFGGDADFFVPDFVGFVVVQVDRD